MTPDDIVLISDPAVVAVPVVESGEGLVDIRGCHSLRLDARHRDPDGDYALLRSGILDRLARAQGALPDGLHLLIIEGYRPPALQLAYFTEYRDQLRSEHPDWAEPLLSRMVSRYIAPPDIAPHTAGAAVDLTLCREDGAELDMGTPVNASPEDSSGACYFAASVTPTARANRDLLARVLGDAGLVNYPTEWWHWSYGDRYWAHATGAGQARYAAIDSRTVGR